MSLTKIVYKVCNRIGPIKEFLRSRMIARLKNDSQRKNLNIKYNRLSFDAQSVYHTLFATMLDDEPIENFVWEVDFVNQKIKMPITSPNIGLEWNTALSINGHGKEIKKFYHDIISSSISPKVFFDVGANYGTHSLLFLKHGVSTFSFEPNPNCHSLFEKLCKSNNVEPVIINKALSDKRSSVDLYFPKKETWLGTIEPDIKTNLEVDHDLDRYSIDTITLDNFCSDNGQYPDLIKIDTEGHELSVLKGATSTMQDKKPIILFECNQKDKRNDIYSFLESQNYDVFTLPYTGSPIKSSSQFLKCDDTDFLALAMNGVLDI